MPLLRLSLRLALFFLVASPLLAVFDSWQPVPHEATHANLWSVAYGDRTLVAVGEQGAIVTFNYDDPVWSPQTSGTTDWLVGAGFGAGRFIVVGDRGLILTSDDRGATWTSRVSGTTIRLNAVAHGNGLWLAVGEQGVVLTSPDGTTWMSRPRVGDGTQFLRALAFGQGRFLVGGARGALYTTTDGMTFTPVAIATTADIEAAAITTSRFVVAGSNGLRAHATQLGTWSFNLRPGETYRGAAVRNLEEVSAVGEGVGATFVLSAAATTTTWSPALSPPRFLATAAIRGLDELIAVGFGGNIARSAINTYLPTIVSDSRRDVVQGRDVRLSLVLDREILTYQWTHDGADLPGATTPELVLRNVTPAAAGTYGVRLTTVAGVLTRAIGPLRVLPAGAPDPRDPTFSPQLSITPTHAVPLANGKILVAGLFNLGAGDLKPYRLVRLLPDGSIDPTFASGATAPTFPALGALRVGTDGKIYVYAPPAPLEVPGLPPAFPPQRLLPDGLPDPTPIEPGSPPSPTIRSPEGRLVTRLDVGDVTYTATGFQTRLTSSLAFSSSLPGYLAPPPSPSPNWSGFSYGYRSDGALWQVRSDASLNSTSAPFRATLYAPDGRPDRSAFATLPDLNFYTILAVALDGAIYANTRDDGAGPPSTFIRIRPLTGQPGRLTNLSIRTFLAAADAPLIAGFVTTGTGETRALLRAIGPGLAPFNVTDAMPDPTLSLVVANTTVATNDQWPATLAPRFPALGAFALAADSRDAALETTLAAGDYSAVAFAAPGSAAGTVLLELYESAPDAPRHFVNLSARGTVAANRPLIAGFTISGQVPVRLLVRGIGPALQPFGISNALADPTLTLYRDNVPLYSNDQWSVANHTLTTSNAGTGAFPLPSGSRDAAMLLTLAPGSYTAVLESANNSTGIALIEMYELP